MDTADQPLAPTAFYVLFALSEGDRHGYAIMQETRELSDGGFHMGPATLYTTIQRLLDSSWIREVSGPADADSRRRYYRLTKDGSAVLQQELKRMELLVKRSKASRLRSAESAS